jgi:hypothetical protein
MTRLLAVPTAIRRSDEVAANYPSELSDALAVRTSARKIVTETSSGSADGVE